MLEYVMFYSLRFHKGMEDFSEKYAEEFEYMVVD